MNTELSHLMNMKLHIIILLLAASSCCTDLVVNGDDNTTLKPSDLQNASCPTWMDWNIQQRRCVCEADYVESVVFCSDNSKHLAVGVLHGYCITHTKFDNQTFIVGSCQYNLKSYKSQRSYPFYFYLPLDPSLVERAMCGSYNRSGQLCGDCIYRGLFSACVHLPSTVCSLCTAHQ